jgi:DNA-binding NarL/FixJ family response regulator
MTENFRNVLIVDDNATVRAAIRSFLASRPELKSCCEAADGVEAVQVAKAQKPGLVLMDLSMPNMNGVEAAASIRELLPRTKIVVFTFFPDLLGRSMAKAVGVDLVIDKERGSAGLLEALEGLLEGKPID